MKRKKMFGKYTILAITVSMIAVILALYSQFEIKKEVYKPVEGALHILDWDSANSQTTTIGEWEFYWKELYDYDDFSHRETKAPLMVQVPLTWNQYEVDGENLPGFGYGTYRIEVTVPNQNDKLGLRIESMSTAYKVFINDVEIASNGSVAIDGKMAKLEYKPQLISFIPPSESFDLIVQVSNYIYARGGIW